MYCAGLWPVVVRDLCILVWNDEWLLGIGVFNVCYGTVNGC